MALINIWCNTCTYLSECKSETFMMVCLHVVGDVKTGNVTDHEYYFFFSASSLASLVLLNLCWFIFNFFLILQPDQILTILSRFIVADGV